jgi:predicted RNA binding protein YcfA (HicA-like mRNA interferase family)
LIRKFPRDAPKRRVISALEELGFELIRDREHIQMQRGNPDGGTTPLTMPAHRTIKGSTLRAVCTQAGISREEFLRAYYGRG